MKLKFLLFPIALVISFVIFMGYIWPEIETVQTLNQENSENEKKLQSVKDRQAAIKAIGAKISSDKEGELFVKNYLPDKKVDEQIINKLNFLATDSGVSLINVAIGKNTNAAKTSSSSSESFEDEQSSVNELNFLETTVTISGSYSKIKMFLNQVQRMPIFNSIGSMTIAAKEKGPNETAASNDLNATIVLNFGYVKAFKLDDRKVSQFKTDLDSSAIISVLKSYTSQKAPDVTYRAEVKTDPFLP